MNKPNSAKPAKKSVALSGTEAGNSSICTVGNVGNDLYYRGYGIAELAKSGTFEEIAYLLIYGSLPDKSQLDNYKTKLKRLRGLPGPVLNVLEEIPAAAHPMDVLRTGCSVLGTIFPEKDDHAHAPACDYCG